MTRITRRNDGNYEGKYRGQKFTVCKEFVRGARLRAQYVWVARCGTIIARSRYYANSRVEAVRDLQRQIDRAAVELPPEFRAILSRWTQEVRTLTPHLIRQHPRVALNLERLQEHLRGLEDRLRGETLAFQEMLAELGLQSGLGSPSGK
jgi:hypothetical protein